MRMSYLRRPEGKKRGNPCKESKKTIQFAKSVMPVIPDAPLLPTGEDEASQQRHLRMLKSEMKKVNPNKQIYRELMKKTFPTRRKAVVEGLGTVKEILDTYPALRFPDEVSTWA